MQEPTFLILSALAGGRKHGYALIQEAAEMSDGRITLKVGTLYAALDRLAREGLIVRSGEEVSDGRVRRYYELSAEGAEQLEAEAARMRSLAAQATARLRQRSAGLTAS
jgi:PadR family transcriptional regulator, regulatory protein PadR